MLVSNPTSSNITSLNSRISDLAEGRLAEERNRVPHKALPPCAAPRSTPSLEERGARLEGLGPQGVGAGRLLLLFVSDDS